MNNIDVRTVEGFGDEWSRFNQSRLDNQEYNDLFLNYFDIFPWAHLKPDAVGFDLGCGSGRWAKGVSERVGTLYCIDPSADALAVAKKNLLDKTNCQFCQASVDTMPLPDGSMDFGYSLGVLHHVPDTQKGLQACVSKLRPGAPFLLYLYYAFDQRSWAFRLLWKSSDLIRRLVSKLPYPFRYSVSQLIALLVYWPLARSAKFLERLGLPVDSFPLSFYRDLSFYTMRTDALDRFGTRLEQRFTAMQIKQMMEVAGLEKINFSQRAPYWVAVGYRK